jgi:hypothetical protein
LIRRVTAGVRRIGRKWEADVVRAQREPCGARVGDVRGEARIGGVVSITAFAHHELHAARCDSCPVNFPLDRRDVDAANTHERPR